MFLATDKEIRVEVDPICEEQVIGRICQDKAENQGTSKSKGLRRTTKSNVELSDSVVMKPSCPTKKRVQVAKYPLPETPMQPAKLEGGFVNFTCNESKESSVVRKDNPVLSKGPVLTPFFWLREEEQVEKSSQHTEDGYITPPDVPCFSDLKDTADESSDELSPTVSTDYLVYLVLIIILIAIYYESSLD